MSAVRNLGGRELNGRPLRIDSATNAPGGGGGGGGFGGGEMGRPGGGRTPANIEVILCIPGYTCMYMYNVEVIIVIACRMRIVCQQLYYVHRYSYIHV